MRALTVVVLSLFVGAGSSVAADLQTAPLVATIQPINWSGFYLGINAGGGIANAPSDFSLAGLPITATAPNSLLGALGGVQAGYNWQSGAIVFGLEADFQLARIKGSIEAPCAVLACTIPIKASYGHDVSWFGTARGRVGYAADTWMAYLTGGYVYSRLNTTAIAATGPVEAVAKWSDTASGWTVGGGVEIAVSAPWSLKLEYLYADFGRSTITWRPTLLPTINDSTHLDLHIVRLGANYRF